MIEELKKDSRFMALSPEAKRIVLEKKDPSFNSLSEEAKKIVVNKFGTEQLKQTTSEVSTTPTPASRHIRRVEPQEDTGIFSRILGDLGRRAVNVESAYTPTPSELQGGRMGLGESLVRAPLRATRLFGQATGLVGDVGGEVLSSLTPEFIKQGLSNAFEQGIKSTPGGDKFVQGVSRFARQAKMEHPEAVNLAEDLTNIAGAVASSKMPEKIPQVAEKIWEGRPHPLQALTNTILGRITHKGAASFKEGPGHKGFFKYLWGDQHGGELVKKAEAGLKASLEKGKSEYRRVNAILERQHGPVNFVPIGDALNEGLDRFDINFKHEGFKRLLNNTYPRGPRGPELRKLDLDAVFGLSGFRTPEGRERILQAIKTVHDWGKSRDFLTPKRLDLMKQSLGGILDETTNKQARDMITNIINATRETIGADFPAYFEMQKGYETMKTMQEQLGRAMSIKNNAERTVSIDTALKKLLTTIREEPEFRRQLLGEITKGGPAEGLLAELAGMNLRNLSPTERQMWGTGLLSYITKNPEWMLAIAAESPRIAGTLTHISRSLSKFALDDALPTTVGAAYRTLPTIGASTLTNQSPKKEPPSNREMDILLKRFEISNNEDKASLKKEISRSIRRLPNRELRRVYSKKWEEMNAEK